ncbi:sugar porter family MFS transporter [Microvirga brassicacearum]|uniref:Sugar porter family MFS transporter n=1 Tax=Microvirga brassicacearum TaxID=2580413 RepID=A0A5N3PAP2_9HYPH|nr:sugar porter family MFS transporter [Microvirga brassicacearum]KAB0266797.1 sugar porter family MFS transporter [Microvirga brassicacearum]
MIGKNWKIDNIGPTVRISILVSCFGLSFGFGTASIAGLLDVIRDQFGLSIHDEQALVASLVVACFVGAAVAGPVSAVYGRRRAIFLAIVLGVTGYAIMLGGPGLVELFVARVLVGLSIGLSSMVVPMYAAETTIARHRGAVVALFQLAVTSGILGAYGVSLAFVATVPWHILLGIGIIPVGCGLLGLLLLPESPRWLAVKGDRVTLDRAAHALGLHAELPVSQPAPVSSQSTFSLLRRGSTMAVLVLCSLLFVLQNLSGIDGILYYAPRIFRGLGFSAGTAAMAATFGLGLINFLATLVALVLVDRTGRRPLLIWGSAAMVLGLAAVVVAAIFDWSWLGLVGLALYIAAFAVSLGPLPYVLMSELFPAAIREQGVATASATSWLFNALVAFTFLSMVDTVGLPASIGAFLAICLLSLIICALFVPETRAVRLEVIEANVLSGQRVRRLGLPLPVAAQQNAISVAPQAMA